MTTLKKLMKFATLLLLPSLLAGCETPTAATPVTNLKPFRSILWSCQDTPETRKQVLAHNSVLATLKSGKRTVYSDDCEQPKPQPKTS